ncbi:reverse transcriptase [Apostichopus japonicus]|uniref:Reverse transcriptase n=1 Tax=Stichopus japonicus TaxID=307972 RepID=A0A2G8LBU8_STIJA|nr:reverse transcriptase [Apostichopus japonicus]
MSSRQSGGPPSRLRPGCFPSRPSGTISSLGASSRKLQEEVARRETLAKSEFRSSERSKPSPKRPRESNPQGAETNPHRQSEEAPLGAGVVILQPTLVLRARPRGAHLTAEKTAGGGETFKLFPPMGNYHRDKWVLDTIANGYRIEFTPAHPSGAEEGEHRHPRTPSKNWLSGGDCGLLAKQAVIEAPEGRDPLPVVLLSHTKTGRNLASHLKPQTPQPKFCQAKTIPHGKPTCCLTPSQKGHVGGDRRPKDAYLHIPMHREHRRYVAFHYDGRDYLFRSLPFGLSTAPRVFTRVAGATVSFLRRRELPYTCT